MCSIIKRKKLTENITNVQDMIEIVFIHLFRWSDVCVCVFFPSLDACFVSGHDFFFLPRSYEGEFGGKRAITIAWLKNKNNDLISFHLELLVLFRSFLY